MLTAEEKKIALTVVAIQLFESYPQVLLVRQRHTYDDMLGWVIRLLTGDKSLQQSYQDRFRHFTVDKYQDRQQEQGQRRMPVH